MFLLTIWFIVNHILYNFIDILSIIIQKCFSYDHSEFIGKLRLDLLIFLKYVLINFQIIQYCKSAFLLFCIGFGNCFSIGLNVSIMRRNLLISSYDDFLSDYKKIIKFQFIIFILQLLSYGQSFSCHSD